MIRFIQSVAEVDKCEYRVTLYSDGTIQIETSLAGLAYVPVPLPMSSEIQKVVRCVLTDMCTMIQSAIEE